MTFKLRRGMVRETGPTQQHTSPDRRTAVRIDIDVPEQYRDDLRKEITRAVRAIRDRYICPSEYGDDLCVLERGHDGPTCTDGVREWPCPFGGDVPAEGQRVFETGRKVRHRTTGTLYVMGSVAEGTVQLKDGPSSTYEPVGSSFWARYYSVTGRPVQPTITFES